VQLATNWAPTQATAVAIRERRKTHPRDQPRILRIDTRQQGTGKESKVRDIEGLYLNPPDRALFYAWTRKAKYRLWIARRRFCHCEPGCRKSRLVIKNAMAPPPFRRLQHP
jgi:hypothetical protein